MNQQINDPTSIQFEQYLEESKGIIYKVASSYCKDADDRKDLIQEIIIQLWRAYRRYNGSVKLSTWTYRVALNVAISYYRKDAKRKTIMTDLPGSLVDIVADKHPTPSQEKFDKLQQFISELKEVDRVLTILYLEDKSQKEIAEIMGLSETNVSTKIGRIKEKLRVKFQLSNR